MTNRFPRGTSATRKTLSLRVVSLAVTDARQRHHFVSTLGCELVISTRREPETTLPVNTCILRAVRNYLGIRNGGFRSRYYYEVISSAWRSKLHA